MKNIILFITLLIFGNCGFAQIQTHITPPDTSEPEVFNIVEKMPAWYSCEKNENEEERYKCTSYAMQTFLAKNIIYPTKARDNGITGTVYVTFIINEDGKVINAKILRGISDQLDEEALRVINKMPTWQPGVQKGNPVSVQFNVPVKFTIR
jgi:periplasmic protein TonB